MNLDLESSSRLVLGLDPTAGTWASCMDAGIKPMTSALVRVESDGSLRLAPDSVQPHESNRRWWSYARSVSPSAVAIDGPCAAVGFHLRPDATGWVITSPSATRASERALAREGFGLFWTTPATVDRFDGASRWIARSLHLFDQARHELPGVPVIETYPHAVLTLLARHTGLPTPLPAKASANGRHARLQVLRTILGDFSALHLPDHDAIDAAAAAVLAAHHLMGRARSLGTSQDGGSIWLPAFERPGDLHRLE